MSAGETRVGAATGRAATDGAATGRAAGADRTAGVDRTTGVSAATPGGGPVPAEHDTGTRRPRLASIWAQDRERVIGTGTGMLWQVPADFAHFRSETLGCPVIMGRASWETLGGALPQRPNIVITSNPDYDAPGAQVVISLEAAVELGRSLASDSGASTVWITGGGRVYAEAMGLVDELVVTDLDLDAVAAREHSGRTVRAPEIDSAVWTVDPARTDTDWRPVSGDARWRVTTWVRR